MMSPAVQTLDVPGVAFSMQDHLMMIEIDNAFARAKLTTHGASLLSYIPKDGEELIWVSESAVYDGKKPVRGGIPVCWPWFGAHPSEEGLPAHGFVRNAVWHLDSVKALESGATEVVLSFEANEASLAIWPHQFHLELKVVVGEKLTMTLTTTNLNAYDLEITEALHTYFQVGNAAGIEVEGLEGSLHLDKLHHKPAEKQTTGVVVHPPMDSVYLNQTGLVTIKDKGKGRQILIEKSNSQSAVVWNPGIAGAKLFADMPDDAWPYMLCVEAGNVLDNAVTIASGEKHAFTMTLSSQID